MFFKIKMYLIDCNVKVSAIVRCVFVSGLISTEIHCEVERKTFRFTLYLMFYILYITTFTRRKKM